jgi:hypothetical protein
MAAAKANRRNVKMSMKESSINGGNTAGGGGNEIIGVKISKIYSEISESWLAK